MNVLVILEDTPNDQHIAVSVMSALFQSAGRTSKVRALQERMGSVEQAMDFTRLLPIIGEHRMVDVFVLLVDRDCRAPNRLRGGNRAHALADLEEKIRDSGTLTANQHFLGCQAIEELEIWLLAGFPLPNWQAMRDDCDPKEAFFEPFTQKQGVFEYEAAGRRELMKQAIRHYRRIKQLCPEVQALEERVRLL